MHNIAITKRFGEAAIGLLLFLLGAWWAWKSYQLGLHAAGEIGPGAFPFGIGLLLAASGLGCAIRSSRSSGTVCIEWQALILFAITVLFGLLFVFFSPVLAGTFFLGFMLKTNGKLPAVKALIVAALISGILFVVFDVLLGVQLPADQLVEWVKS